MFAVIILSIVLIILIIFGLAPAMLSSEISQEEREQYYRIHGEWPDW